jgi:hypothetical protein
MKLTAMYTEPHDSRSIRSRIASRQELTAFYRAIGISAVASAALAAKMTVSTPAAKHELPAFLRDAHAVG